MPTPLVTFSDWRAKVDAELDGQSFERALVAQTPEGIAVQPLYVGAPRTNERWASAAPFRICMRHEAGATTAEVEADIAEGADAVWVPAGVKVPPGVFAVIDWATGEVPTAGPYALNFDPIGELARGVRTGLEALATFARSVPDGSTGVMVSTLPYHEAGANAVDELAFALATGVRYFEAMLEAGMAPDAIAATMALQVSVGRDTFLELCKLRALRTVWAKLLVAFGAKPAGRTLIHAVCASRTMTTRDPWVNLLRVTTQVFSAVLGGADVVTPNAFDQALGLPSAHGRRVARKTGLVLREES
jgi:methylmalonyl-CoA mutase